MFEYIYNTLTTRSRKEAQDVREDVCFNIINKICPDMHREDGLLGYVDDLDFIGICMEVELAFGCTIEEGETVIDDFNTVGDLSKWLAEKVK